MVQEGQDEQNVPPPPPSGNGDEVRIIRFGGEGDTKSITTIKGDMVKTFTETDMGRTTIIRDNKNKKTTTLLEMMGNKNGFYATDEEQEQMRKQMDSMMQSRRQGTDQIRSAPSSFEVINTTATKKVAGYNCKKVYIVATRQNGNKDSSEVWYTPDFKLGGLNSTGGAGGGIGSLFSRNTTMGGFDKLDGFPMQYETRMGRGRKMIVEVQKVVTDKEIADKEFIIPKDFTLKPIKDMQNGMGRGGFQIGRD